MDEQKINEYRQPWESDEHWTLRKEFIEKFWDDFPEDRLLCLAQVYSNVELLGCSYPAAVMRQIRELSKDMNESKELREKRKERAAVQFVKAKQQKAPPPRNSWNNSGSLPQKRPDAGNDLQSNCATPTGTSFKKLKTSDSKLPSDSSCASACSSSNKDLGTTEQSSLSKDSQPKSNTVCASEEKSSSKDRTVQESNPLSSAPSTSEACSQKVIWPKGVQDNIVGIGQFIRKYLAIQNTPLEILNNMSTKFSLKVDYNVSFFSEQKSGPVHECSVEIDNVFIVKVKELTKKKARSEAARLVVDMLMSPSAKMEKSSSSTSNESKVANSTKIQDEKKHLGETPSQKDVGVKSCMSAKTTSTNKNSDLLRNKSNLKSGVHENTHQNNNLLSDPRIHHDPPNQRVTSNVYNNSSYMHSLWTNRSAAEPYPRINKAVVVPDPWINNTATGTWNNNNNIRHRPLKLQSNQDSDCTYPSSQFLVILDNSDVTKSDTATSIFTQSANFNHVPFQFAYEALVKDSQTIARAEISLNGQAFCFAEAENKQAAKEAASKMALDILRKTAYTIKVNDEHEGGFTVTRSQIFNTAESNNSLTDSNIGCKMLKMMGWSGGGIGKVGKQGIEEPVKAVEKHKFGQGLGYTKKGNEEVSFTARAEQIIQDYAKSKSTSDLIFSTEFSKEERKEIHRIACKYNLKNNSKGGKGDGRHIIISRRYTAQQLINCLIQAGGRTHKYELISPIG